MPDYTPPGGVSSETDPVASGITGILKSDGATLSGISGTSGQFVKGDGTLDSTAYGTGTIDGTLTATRVPFAQDSNTLTDDADFNYDATNDLLNVTKILTQVVVDVHNATGSAIPAGTPVYVTGSVTSGKPDVEPSDANNAATMLSVGIVTNNIGAGSSGYIAISGLINGISTSVITDVSPAAGDTLYVSTTVGELTTTKPTGTSDLIQNVGRILSINGGNFKMTVNNLGRTNDVPNQFTTTGSQTASAHITTGGASTDFVKGDGSLDSSTYLTSFTETDPVVGAITGIVKADGGGNISAAIADTDYATPAGAITAVEGEATLDLTGDVTVAAGQSFVARRLPTVSSSTDPLLLVEATHAGRYLIYSGSSGTVNLPATSTAGEHYTILNVTGGDITIGRNTNNINGAASDFTLGTYNGATAIAIGSNNWVVLG